MRLVLAAVAALALARGGLAATPTWPAECNSTAELPMSGRGGGAQIDGPTKFDIATVEGWLGRMKAMRSRCQQAIGFNGSAALVQELKWTQTAYISPQMHPYDRFFFDPALGNGTGGAGYTVDKWLADLNTRYGGIDKALIWPTYTNIGIDDRNTFDLIRSLPGGVEGIKVVVQQLHARGVKVLWPYHPWDHSTRGQQRNNETDPQAMAELQRDTGADGFNGDTMAHIPKAFYDAAVSIYKPIAMEAEAGGSNAWDLNYVTVGWGEGWGVGREGAAPAVDKPKWLTNGKFQTNWCDRWSGNPALPNKHKIPEIQVSWFNGLGYESWENVWGTWNGMHERDGEALRRVGIMLRYFGRRGFLQSEAWVPHSTDVLTMELGIFGSKFPLEQTGEVVYTLVNRQAEVSSHEHLKPSGAVSGLRWYDCYRGTELSLTSSGKLRFTLEPNGFGCILGARGNHTRVLPIVGSTTEQLALARRLRARTVAPAQPADLRALLSTMSALTTHNLSAFSDAFVYPNFTLVDWAAKTPVRPLNDAKAGEEVYVHGGDFHFQASGVEIEGKLQSGVDVQYPWEPHAMKAHDHMLHMGALYVDKYPVTNANYSSYLARSSYVPSDKGNWLKQNFVDWGGLFPKEGWENRPVTYVSLADARHYCAFHQKRLPHVHEWQYFASGTDGRLFPWGERDDARLTPDVSNDYVNPGPPAVGQHPGAASPFGVEDLVRTVWQMTTEVHDPHTRSILLRGGSNYGPWRGASCRWIDNNDGTPRLTAPACYNKNLNISVPGSLPHPMGGSHWYFPPAFDNKHYNKYFLMSGSYERAGTIGFRCVADAIDDCGTGGHLCATQQPAPATVILGGAGERDWAIFDGELGRMVSKAGVNAAHKLSFKVLAGSTVGNASGSDSGQHPGFATSFSWQDGSPISSGSNQRTGVAFFGHSSGIEITSPAPTAANRSSTLKLFVGLIGAGAGVRANVSAHVENVVGSHKAVLVKMDAQTLTLTYTGGPLLLRYAIASSSMCADPTWCIQGLPAAIKINKVVELSPPVGGHRLVDWAHWGTGTAVAPWHAETMKHGPGLLRPKLVTRSGAVVGGNLSESLHTFNNAAAYSYKGGVPIASATRDTTGLWTAGDRLFSMTIPTMTATSTATAATTTATSTIATATAPSSSSVYKLVLYVGAFQKSGVLSVSSPGQKDMTLVIPGAKPGNNVAVTVVFSGIAPVTVNWMQEDPEQEGNITWQSAVLMKEDAGSGCTLQAAILS